MANIQLQILRPVRKALNEYVGTELLNPGELWHHMINHNHKVVQETPFRIQPNRGAKDPPLQTPEFVVRNMDFKALYPNRKKDKSAAKIEKAFTLANLDFWILVREFLVKIVSIAICGTYQDKNLQEFFHETKS